MRHKMICIRLHEMDIARLVLVGARLQADGLAVGSGSLSESMRFAIRYTHGEFFPESYGSVPPDVMAEIAASQFPKVEAKHDETESNSGQPASDTGGTEDATAGEGQPSPAPTGHPIGPLSNVTGLENRER